MRTRTSAFAAVACCGLLLGACVSLKRTPEARFFVLRSLAEPLPANGTPEAGIVGLLSVSLPGHLERPQLIAWRGPNEVRVDEYTRWAEPLGEAVSRVLAENLEALLPEHQVVRYPWPSATKLTCRVRVAIQIFAPQANGEVLLEGRWEILPPGQARALVLKPVVLRRGPLAAAPGGADPAASVEALSELLADLAREIAPAVRAQPSAPTGSRG